MLVMETMRCVPSSVFGVTLKLNIESTLTALLDCRGSPRSTSNILAREALKI